MPKKMEAPSTNNHFIGAMSFNIQFEFYIPLFQGHIDVDALGKCVGLLRGGVNQ
jgi:hypothetical protein